MRCPIFLHICTRFVVVATDDKHRRKCVLGLLEMILKGKLFIFSWHGNSVFVGMEANATQYFDTVIGWGGGRVDFVLNVLAPAFACVFQISGFLVVQAYH